MILRNGEYFSSTAQKTYEHYAKNFKWDLTLEKFFLKQQPLYARCVDKNGYSCWCICHSNYSGTSAANWTNILKNNDNIIEEQWNIPFDNDNSKRITFVKKQISDKKYVYVFCGIYEFIEFDTTKHAKIYKRISKEYSND